MLCKPLKRLIIYLLILGLLLLLGRLLSPRVAGAIFWVKTPLMGNFSVKMAYPLTGYLKEKKILDDLAYCESRNNPDAIGDGGRARGILQFHEGTFVGFALKYGLYPYAEKEEIKNFYLDSEEQRRLAMMMLAKEKEGWRHWTTCAKRIGLDKVNFGD